MIYKFSPLNICNLENKLIANRIFVIDYNSSFL